jgi:TRAP-type uncharacterized transport system substrate-binding protein
MRRTFLWVAAALVTVVAGGVTILAYQYHWLSWMGETVRIATGPVTDSDERFAVSFLREMAKENPRLQVKFIQTADLNASADALKNGLADAALVRSDNAMAAEGRTLALMRKVGVMAILGGQSHAKNWSDLRDKPIGVLSSTGQVDPLQKIVLDFYDVGPERVRLVTPKDAGAQIADEYIAALLVTGPAGPGSISDAARAVRFATQKTPKVLELDGASAMAERYPAYEKLDIPPGALFGSPPMPSEGTAALSVTVRLVSNRALSNYAAGEITRVIMATKARLSASEISVGQIEPPDIDKPVFPIHPGSLAHLAGERPGALDESLTYLAIGSVVVGAFGSFAAWLGSFLFWRLRGETRERVATLPSYLAAIKAGSSDDLNRIESELDELTDRLAEHFVREEIPPERYSSIQAKITEVRAAMARRRAVVGESKGARLATEIA